MYLAFESLVSSHYRSLTREGNRLAAPCFKSASAALRLDGCVFHRQATRRFNCRFILAVVYKDARLPLVHAKEAATISLPTILFPTERRLSRSCPSNPDSHAHGRGLVRAPADGGSVFFGWVYDNDGNASRSSAYASSYDGPFDASERTVHLRFQTSSQASDPTRPELQRGANLRSFPLPVSRAVSGQPRRRVEVASGPAHSLPTFSRHPSSCNGISRFEDLMHIRAMNLINHAHCSQVERSLSRLTIVSAADRWLAARLRRLTAPFGQSIHSR